MILFFFILVFVELLIPLTNWIFRSIRNFLTFKILLYFERLELINLIKIILQAQDFDLLKEALCSTKMNIWPILSAKKLQQVGQKCTINSFVQAIEACETF